MALLVGHGIDVAQHFYRADLDLAGLESNSGPLPTADYLRQLATVSLGVLDDSVVS